MLDDREEKRLGLARARPRRHHQIPLILIRFQDGRFLVAVQRAVQREGFRQVPHACGENASLDQLVDATPGFEGSGGLDERAPTEVAAFNQRSVVRMAQLRSSRPERRSQIAEEGIVDSARGFQWVKHDDSSVG